MKTKAHCLFPLLLGLLAGLTGPVQAQLFTKVTTGHIVTTPSGSRSANFLDFDRDGFQDILITNGTAGGEDDMLYHNEANGTFTLMADTVCHDAMPGDGATCADYDNDGRTDIHIANWYNIDNLLYHNAGASFERIDTGIVPNDGGYSETAAWGDADGDGWLDLYVTNSYGDFRNALYHGLGGGAFEKVAGIAPVTDAFVSRCVNWIDYDLDGDQDIFVANQSNQRNQLYRNDGYPTFTKIMTGPVATTIATSHSSSWGDYDNDGDFDLLVVNYNEANQLFQNDGTGTLSEVTGPFGGDIGCCFSSSWADYDNDADLDLFITNGYCTSFTHNFLYENDGSGHFTRNLTEPMAIDSGSSYGCAWGDYDNDGFLDLVVANWRNEAQPNALYHNEGNSNHWVQLDLEGTVSNRSAIGAIVRCLATVNGQPVWQMRDVTAQSGYCSQNSLVVQFGLGDALVIDSLEVIWPSGIVQTLTQVVADSMYKVVENGALSRADAKPGHPRLDVHPNPSDGNFRVTVVGADDPALQLEVVDALGRVVAMRSLQGADRVVVPMALPLAAGTYLVRVTNGTGLVLHQRLAVGR